MTPPAKEGDRSGGDRAAPDALPNFRHRIVLRMQAAIERAALWGLVPVTLARRIARRIGGGDA